MAQYDMPPTCYDLLARAQAIIEAAGVPTARLDAEVLLAHAMQLGRAALYTRLREAVPPDVCETFAAAVERRARREPVAYLTGVREFWSLPFGVTRDVLIPRPETELLVEVVCELFKGSRVSPLLRVQRRLSEDAAREANTLTSPFGKGGLRGISPKNPHQNPPWPPFAKGGERCSREDRQPQQGEGPSCTWVCDVGTGSGCIAVSVAHELASVRVLATDLSSDALDVARRNARAHGVESRITFVQSDLLAGIDPAVRFDLIVSNPPYVAADEEVDPEARWEPALALRAGPQGLDVIRRLLPEARSRLRPGGWLVMELGCGQADAVVDLAESFGFGSIEVRSDLAGTPRVLRTTFGMRNAEWAMNICGFETATGEEERGWTRS